MKAKSTNTTYTKSRIAKCDDLCITYSDAQLRGTQYFASMSEVRSFKANVAFEASDKKGYTTDILAVSNTGTTIVAECVDLKMLCNAGTMKKLDLSRDYWLSQGVSDWRIIAVDTGEGST